MPSTRTPTAEQSAAEKRGSKKGRPGWLRAVRILLPAVLILAWLVAASSGGPLFGRIDEVSSNDRTSYLPASSDAAAVQKEQAKFSDSDAIPAIIVFEKKSALSGEDLASIRQKVQQLGELSFIDGDVSPAITSEDGKAAQAFVPIAEKADTGDAVEKMSSELKSGLPSGVSAHVTGPAGFTADLSEAFSGIDGLLLGVALLAVLVILLIVYRSLLLPFLVLVNSMFALCAALLVVFSLAKAGVLLLSGQAQGILFILVIGAATDYSLLLVSRYREELARQADRGAAILRAMRGSIEPILASGGTVIAGLLCLLVSDLGSNSTLGPVASIGIVFAMLSAFTLLPALLFVCGRVAFWPRTPKFIADSPRRVAHEGSESGVWGAIARRVARHPRAIWVTVTLVLVAGCGGLLQLKADGVPQSDLVLGSSEARTGQSVLGKHFPPGSGSPAQIIVPRADLNKTADALLDNDGVASVSVATKDSQTGSATVTKAGIVAQGPPGTKAPSPTTVDGKVLVQATLTHAADSSAAEQTVREIRTKVPAPAIVGGVTATAIDTNDASVHDRNLIIPMVLGVILVILVLLLRAIVAPILLILTTALSFGMAMGVAALVFNHVLHFPGADATVPLYGFVFLVALGIDYNIFLMTRVREETKTLGSRRGMLRGLTLTGGVITSAGIVLAATFAALAVIPILFLAQLAFIVAFGVLLDTLVVRTLLVPALGYDLGRVIWWPSKLSGRERDEKAARIEVSDASAHEVLVKKAESDPGR